MLLLVVALMILPPVAARAGSLSRRAGSRTVTTTGADARAGMELPDVLIVAGTDSVWIDRERLVRSRDYSIDYERRTLTLDLAVPDTVRVTVSYLHLPLDVKALYRHAVLESLRGPGPEGEVRMIEVAEVDRTTREPAPGLRVGGAKTFGITLGSDRDLRLEQSLRMNISGKITRDVRISAYLSDQNTPLVPEGDTEELRTLDKVLVEIEGERASASMGDYELRVDGGRLAQVRRELTGATVTAEGDRTSLLLAGARLAGEFRSAAITGVEGKQGPYLLTDAGDAAGVSVVAGSERVWLDGVRLKRGRDNDYVIDYVSGEIEFTERRHITAENEIVVDYEYALGDFERDIYGGRATADLLEGRARLGLTLFREADDRRASASVPLTDGQIAILEAAGDDLALAHDDGVDSVGMGNGDYVRAAEGWFEYAGPDSGDFDLFFEPEEGGDYTYDYILGHYEYVEQPEVGEYRLGRSLPVPTDHGLLAVDGRVDLPNGAYVAAEGAVSSLDLNTFSDLDDDDNLGNAATLDVGLPGLGIGSSGASELGLSVRTRRVAGNFRGVSRFRDVRYQQVWELAGLDLPEEELMVEGISSLSLSSGGVLDVSHALLRRGDDFDGRKSEFSVRGRPTASASAWINGRFVDVESRADGEAGATRERSLYGGGLDYAIGPVKPGVSYTHDSRTSGDGGERYDEYGVFVGSAGGGSSSFWAKYAHRLTDRTAGDEWSRASTTRTQEYRASLRGWDALTLDGSVVRRRTDFEPGYEDPGSKYDLASVRAQHRSFGGNVTGEVRYTITSTEVEEKELRATGEDGELQVVSTGVYLPVTDLSAGTRWNLKFLSGGRGDRLPQPTRWRRFLSALSFETDVKLREVTTTGSKKRLYLLDPAVLLGDDTVNGEVSSRHTLRFVLPSGAASVRLAFRTRDEVDGRYVDPDEGTRLSDRGRERLGTADVKISRPGGITYRVQGDLGTRDRGASRATESFDVLQRSLLVEIGVRQSGALETRLTGGVTREEERLGGLRADLWRVTPSVTYRIKGKGALTASVTRVSVEASSESSFDRIPSYMAEGRQPGVSSQWRLTGDYKLGRYLTGSLSYVGERPPDAETRHTLDARVNAFF